MADSPFDVAILGGGTGGYVAAIRAAQLGLKVALVEEDKVGGTCLHRGCIPTKALLESGEVLDLVRRSGEFGVHTQQPSYDYGEMLARKQKIVDQLHQGVQGLLRQNKVTVYYGRGKLQGPMRLEVAPAEGSLTTIQARNTIIATGSYPRSLPGLEIDGKMVLSSDHILELERPPASLVIVGAGAIGVEFASLYADLGTEVTLLEALPSLVPLEDRDIGTELARRFRARGIKAIAGAKVLTETFERTPTGMTIEVEAGGQRQIVSGEKLLIAVGRAGVTDGTGVQGLKVEIDRSFIKVDDFMRTGEPNVFAIGDVNGGFMLAHVAAAEGRLAVETIAGQRVRPMDYNRVPRCTYSRPQIATMGLSEQEAVEGGHKVKTGRFPFAANARALIFGESGGFCKVVADEETGELLGVHIIGPQATELIPEAALGRFLEATPVEIGESIHAHPTLAEVLGEAALDVQRRAIHIFRR